MRRKSRGLERRYVTRTRKWGRYLVNPLWCCWQAVIQFRIRTCKKSYVDETSKSTKARPTKDSRRFLVECFRHLAAGDQLREPCEVFVHDAVFFHRGTHCPNRRMGSLSTLRGFQRRQKVDCLGHSHGFDGQHVARVFDDALQFNGGRQPHGDVAFLDSPTSERIDPPRLGPPFGLSYLHP